VSVLHPSRAGLSVMSHRCISFDQGENTYINFVFIYIINGKIIYFHNTYILANVSIEDLKVTCSVVDR
jgi:hypothetical protein